MNGAGLEDARDATQDAFLEAWEMIKNRPGDWEKVKDPGAWLRSVALRRYRRPPGPRRRPRTIPAGDAQPECPRPDPDPAELVVGTQSVLEALGALDPETRAVMAFHLDGFSSVQIAPQLGMSDQRVRNLLKKSRRELARILARREEGGTNR